MEDDPDRALAEKADALAGAIEAAVGPWLVDAVQRVAAAQRRAVDEDRLLAAADEARADVVPRVRVLLAADIDEQTTTPLALLRDAVGSATAVLRELGAAPVERDPFAVRAFPEDVYGLVPATFEDVARELKGPGLEWGAAKAFVHLRRRAEGAGS